MFIDNKHPISKIEHNFVEKDFSAWQNLVPLLEICRKQRFFEKEKLEKT